MGENNFGANKQEEMRMYLLSAEDSSLSVVFTNAGNYIMQDAPPPPLRWPISRLERALSRAAELSWLKSPKINASRHETLPYATDFNDIGSFSRHTSEVIPKESLVVIVDYQCPSDSAPTQYTKSGYKVQNIKTLTPEKYKETRKKLVQAQSALIAETADRVNKLADELKEKIHALQNEAENELKEFSAKYFKALFKV